MRCEKMAVPGATGPGVCMGVGTSPPTVLNHMDTRIVHWFGKNNPVRSQGVVIRSRFFEPVFGHTRGGKMTAPGATGPGVCMGVGTSAPTVLNHMDTSIVHWFEKNNPIRSLGAVIRSRIFEPVFGHTRGGKMTAPGATGPGVCTRVGTSPPTVPVHMDTRIVHWFQKNNPVRSQGGWSFVAGFLSRYLGTRGAAK